MITLKVPLNKGGIMLETGDKVSLPLEHEAELITQGLAEQVQSLSIPPIPLVVQVQQEGQPPAPVVTGGQQEGQPPAIDTSGGQQEGQPDGESAFKAQVQADRAVFLNIDEFASKHKIGTKNYQVVVDNDKLVELKKSDLTGVVSGDILFYGRADTMAEYKPGQLVAFDGKPCTVVSSYDNEGIREVILDSTQGG